MNQHKVKPTPQIVVSALFNSVYNAEDEEQMNAATGLVLSVLLTTTFMNDYMRKWKPPDHVSY